MKERNKGRVIVCDLFILNKGDSLRVTGNCCKPEVIAGIEACIHKIDVMFDGSMEDGSLTCPRAIAAFNLRSLDERILKNR